MTSHDVRSLEPCKICGDIGIHQPKNPTLGVRLVVAIPADGFAHPDCYLKKHGLKALLQLPADELRSIRICDVDSKTVRAILSQLEGLKKCS